MEKKPCPLCGSVSDSELEIRQGGPTYHFFDCPVCGWIRVESGLLHRIADGGEFNDQLYLLTGLSRRNYDRQQPRMAGQGIESFLLNSDTIDQHLSSISIPPDPLDRVDRMLQLLYERTQSFDAGAAMVPARDFPLLFLRTPMEFDYISKIAERMGLLEVPFVGKMLLTPAGWERVKELRSTRIRARQVFVAMWFNTETDAAWLEGFRPAIHDDLGYDPIRIDQQEHINKIDDEIVSAIRSSGFVVADFTGDRGGVYFEAGFAMGLGKPVVWCCRDDEWAKKLHFDTRQYSHIMWKTPADLRSRLAARINAVITPMLPQEPRA